jgi:hypothetical protein
MIAKSLRHGSVTTWQHTLPEGCGSTSLYKEICQILRDFDTVAAIIPDDEEDNMEYLITPFFQLYEELGHDTTRCRIIFEGVHVITTDSGNADR